MVSASLLILLSLLTGEGTTNIVVHPTGPEESAGPVAPPAFLQQERSTWLFSFAPMAGLWFHGMALVDPVGPGSVPLYDPAYPGRAEAAREALQIPTSPLSGRIGEFREAFRSDRAFEVLHFLPLYFPFSGRTEVFEALTQLAGTPSGMPGAITTRTRFGVTALAAVLPTPAERRTLGDFTSALEAEWNGFYRQYQQAQAPGWRQLEVDIQEAWNGTFAGPLTPLLSRLNMTGGNVFLVPALGGEGRVFSGTPADQSDNVLAVAAPGQGERPEVAIFSMIREICFSLSRQALENESSNEPGPGTSEEGIGRGAVQAGAMVLEAVLPEKVEAYQRFFLARAGHRIPSGKPAASAFHAVFPLEEGQIKALRESVSNLITDGGES